MSLTTIKVPTELRDRLSSDAKHRGVPTAVFLGELLDAYEREQRFAEIRAAYATLDPDSDYWDETRAWDTTAADGLPRAER